MKFKLGKYTYTILMFRSETPRPKLDVGTRVIFSRDKNPKNGIFATIEKNEGYPYKYELLTHGGGSYYATANEVYVDKKLLKQWPKAPQRMSTRLIRLHGEAGRIVGEKKTCGKKIAYIDFDKAYVGAPRSAEGFLWDKQDGIVAQFQSFLHKESK